MSYKLLVKPGNAIKYLEKDSVRLKSIPLKFIDYVAIHNRSSSLSFNNRHGIHKYYSHQDGIYYSFLKFYVDSKYYNGCIKVAFPHKIFPLKLNNYRSKIPWFEKNEQAIIRNKYYLLGLRVDNFIDNKSNKKGWNYFCFRIY